MKSPRNFKKCPVSLLGLLLSLPAIILTTFLGVRELNKQRVKPTEIIIANITSTQGEIYWKTKEERNYIVEYTQHSSNETEVIPVFTSIAKDSTTGEYIYSAKIEQLNPSTKYLFSIRTDKFSWDQTSYFKTKEDSEVLHLPELLKGDSEPSQLVLIKTDIGNYIKDTQEHGTWLVEKSTENYSLLTYAKYSLKDNTKEKNSTKFNLNPSPAHAQNNPTTTNPNDIRTLELERGTNLIQIPIFLNRQTEQISSARELIQFSDNYILSIGLFRNDSWEQIVINKNDKIYGEDFDLIAGEVYIFTIKENIDLPIIEGPYSTELNIENLKGWNLVPTSFFNHFSLTSRDILQDKNFPSISQIATWNTYRGSFDYTIENNSSEIIGKTIPLPIDKGLFVKTSY